MLMEVVLALALVVMVGMTVLAAVSKAFGTLRMARERQVAVDLARSAMAKLEAGLETTTTLSGPVRAWSEDANLAEISEQEDETGWELVIESESSPFEGLTYVSITARPEIASDGGGVSFTLRQLVRIAQKDEDGIGEKDAVTIEAEKAIQRGSARPRRPSRPGAGNEETGP